MEACGKRNRRDQKRIRFLRGRGRYNDDWSLDLGPRIPRNGGVRDVADSQSAHCMRRNGFWAELCSRALQVGYDPADEETTKASPSYRIPYPAEAGQHTSLAQREISTELADNDRT